LEKRKLEQEGRVAISEKSKLRASAAVRAMAKSITEVSIFPSASQAIPLFDELSRLDQGCGGEGGILTLALWPSYHVFSNMRKNRMDIADFYDLAFFNCLSYFIRGVNP